MNPTSKSRRWLNSLASVLVLVTVIGSGAWVLTDDETVAETAAYDPTSALPKSILFHASYDGASAARNCRQLALSELWNDKQVQAFAAPVVQWANEMIEGMSQEIAEDTGMSFDDLKTLGKSHSTITLVDVQMEDNAPPMIDWLATLDLGSNNELLGRISAAVERLLKEEAHAEIKMIDLGGIVVRGCEIDQGVDFMWTAMGSHLVMGSQVKTMTEVLARMKAKSTEGGLWENQKFAAAKSQVSPNKEPVFMAFANVDGILDTVEQTVPDSEEVLGMLALFGLDQIKDYTYALNFEGRAVVDRFWMATEKNLDGLLACTKPSNAPFAGMSLAPKDSFFYTGSRVDLSGIADSLLAAMKEMEPRGHEEVMGMLEQLDSELGFSLLGDLLPNLGDEFSVWMGKAPYGSLIPETIFTANVKDEAKIVACMNAAKEKFGANAMVGSFKFMGQELHYCDLGKIMSRDEIGPGLKPCWMIDNGNLMFALAPQTLKNYMASRNSQRDSLAQNTDVANAMAHFKRYNPNTANTSFAYFDLASLITMALDTASPILQSVNFPREAMMGLDVDFNMLPTGDVFRRHLFGFSSATSTTDAGMMSEMHSPFGYVGLITAVAVPVAAIAFTARSQRAEPAWDDVEPPEVPENDNGRKKDK